MEKWPIGVFTSIDAGMGVHLEVAQELGISTIQLHAPHKSTRTAARAGEFLNRIGEAGIRLTAVFGGFEGESYADIPTVEQTVGLVPSKFRVSRLAEMKAISDFAARLKCPVVALHLGFVPHETDSRVYREVVAICRELCDHVAANQQSLHLETGQETAESLVQFIDDVGRANLFVNFDPANMILYGTGEPLAALKRLGSRVRSVHCKDACWANRPGKEWGREVPLGTGEVDIESFLLCLQDLGYTGPLTIEREIPQDREQQKKEIASAVNLLVGLKAKLLGDVSLARSG